MNLMVGIVGHEYKIILKEMDAKSKIGDAVRETKDEAWIVVRGSRNKTHIHKFRGLVTKIRIGDGIAVGQIDGTDGLDFFSGHKHLLKTGTWNGLDFFPWLCVCDLGTHLSHLL